MCGPGIEISAGIESDDVANLECEAEDYQWGASHRSLLRHLGHHHSILSHSSTSDISFLTLITADRHTSAYNQPATESHLLNEMGIPDGYSLAAATSIYILQSSPPPKTTGLNISGLMLVPISLLLLVVRQCHPLSYLSMLLGLIVPVANAIEAANPGYREE